MGIEVKSWQVAFVPHALAIADAVMVLVWCIYFRGGLAWASSNKSLIFNVSLLTTIVYLFMSSVMVSSRILFGVLGFNSFCWGWCYAFKIPLHMSQNEMRLGFSAIKTHPLPLLLFQISTPACVLFN